MTEQEQAARGLVALYAKRVDLAARMARAERPTGAMADEVLTVGRRLDEACETFRRRFFPRSGRVCVGLYAVMVASPAGRSVRTVFDGFAEFAGAGRP